MTQYAVGFAIDDRDRVALIEKNRPAWQAGKLNGIGGHIEPGEQPVDARALTKRHFIKYWQSTNKHALGEQ